MFGAHLPLTLRAEHGLDPVIAANDDIRCVGEKGVVQISNTGRIEVLQRDRRSTGSHRELSSIA